MNLDAFCSLNVVFLQVTSVEVVQAYIDRIQEVNPLLNAVIKDRQEICFLFQLWCITLKSSHANANWTGLNTLFLAPSRFDAALQEAAQVDKLIEEETGGEEVVADRLPLLGVPLSVKESYALQGEFQKSNILSVTWNRALHFNHIHPISSVRANIWY